MLSTRQAGCDAAAIAVAVAAGWVAADALSVLVEALALGAPGTASQWAPRVAAQALTGILVAIAAIAVRSRRMIRSALGSVIGFVIPVVLAVVVAPLAGLVAGLDWVLVSRNVNAAGAGHRLGLGVTVGLPLTALALWGLATAATAAAGRNWRSAAAVSTALAGFSAGAYQVGDLLVLAHQFTGIPSASPARASVTAAQPWMVGGILVCALVVVAAAAFAVRPHEQRSQVAVGCGVALAGTCAGMGGSVAYAGTVRDVVISVIGADRPSWVVINRTYDWASPSVALFAAGVLAAVALAVVASRALVLSRP